MSEFRVVPQAEPLKGTIGIPADKSISHRAAILGALAEGQTRIENFLSSETTFATCNVLRALGAYVDLTEPGTLIVKGNGLHGLREPEQILFCAGSGTTMRLMAGICAGQHFLSILDGTAALKRRPMARVVDPLRGMGADILAREGGRLPPLAIWGGTLRGLDYEMPVASAQVKSAIMLAALFAESTTIIRGPAPSRDHTERMLRAFGVTVASEANSHIIEPVAKLNSPGILRVPNDLSSAAFLIVAALLVPGSHICLKDVGINRTRTGLLDALAQMGANVTIENRHETCGEPIGDIIVQSGGALRGIAVGGNSIPGMIDEFPIFAVAATQAQGETRVKDAAELRVKESDRIATLCHELRKMGAKIEEQPDGFAVLAPTELTGARVSAHNDHRLAMALAVGGMIAHGETVVEGWECVNDSFPNFAEVVASLGHRSSDKERAKVLS